MARLSLILIYGGRSGEHDVSVTSATSVAKALDRRKYDVTCVRVGKDGRWTADASLLGGKKRGERMFVPDPTRPYLRTEDGKRAERIDVAFPLIHGTYGEDGCIQGLFELAGVPYVGAGVLGSAVGMDKVEQKRLLQCAGFPVSEFVAFRAPDWRAAADDVTRDIEDVLGYPCFVKPANLGSSVGITKAHHRKELLKGIKDALRYDTKVIVERAVPDAREIECAVLGNDRPEASVLGEIVPSNEFYDYAAKYVDGSSHLIIPADMPRRLGERLRNAAVGVFGALDAAGMARVDFLVERRSGAWFVNEINTLPGFTPISMYPKLWEATGVPYPRLLDRLVTLAIERSRRMGALRRDFTVPDRT